MTTAANADTIAQGLPDEVERPRVVAALDQRWNKKLTLMSAPGGYGKTRAIAQAIRSNENDPIGLEFYVRCRAAHCDPARLAQAVLNTLGAQVERETVDEALVDRVVDELASFSPTKVVLVLDDVHVLAANPASVELLASIVRELPTNSHVMLVGRNLPEMPLARLRADDALIELDETDLVFTPDEVLQLAERHDVDHEMLSELAGWPALVRLAVVAGKAGPQNFLMQEIVDDLPAAVIRGLAVAVLAGAADDSLLDRCSIDLDAAELTERVPMLDLLQTGQLEPHELWTELLPQLASDDERAEFVREIASWHSESGRHDEAITLAIQNEASELARTSLMQALGSTDISLSAAGTEQWLDLFGGAESIAKDDAELLLLRGWHGRLAHGPGYGDEDVAAALALFQERGDALGEAHASVESAFRGYLAGDVAVIGDAIARGPRLVDAGMTFLRGLGELTSAIVADINGDFSTALEHSLRSSESDVRPEFVQLGLRHRATLYFLNGDSEAAVRTTEELVEFAPTRSNRVTHLMARFGGGDIADLVDIWPEIRYLESGNRRDDFIHAVKSVFLDACLGITPDLSIVRDVTWERPREQFQQALCEWCAAIIDGDEERANAELATKVDALGLDNPMVIGDISRFMVSGYIALPKARAILEATAATQDFGPYQLRLLGLARLLLALRTGDHADWSGYRSPMHTISSMSLPWSVEIASGLVLHDEAKGLELADALFTYTGSNPQPWLRRLAESDALIAPGARRLLALLPAPPEHPTILRTQGGVALRRDDQDHLVSRVRVRQLLLLLALRGTVSRDTAMTMLWPEKDIDKARNNLRITLTHLRNDLEPARRSGEPSFHLRQRGDDIVLYRSEHLQVDLLEIQDGLVAAEAAARAGDRSAQLEALVPVVEAWEPPLLLDLADLEDARSDVEALQAQLVDSTVEVAEACVSSGDWAMAERLARKLLLHDRYNERAHAAAIASHLGADQTSRAEQAIEDCLAALAELGVQPAATTRMLMRRAQYPDDAARRTA